MRWLLIVSVLIAGFFLLFPRADIVVSALFYTPEKGFFWAWSPVVRGVYLGVTWLTRVLVVTLLLVLLLRWAARALPAWMPTARACAFLLLVMALGPGLLVHEGLKEVFGRPRPLHTVEFGGDNAYVPPLHIGEGEGKSFVSGHAAVSFFWCAPALLLARRRARVAVYAGGIAFGLFTGMIRVIQGGHYLSDVLFAGVLTLMVAHLLYAMMYRRPVI